MQAEGAEPELSKVPPGSLAQEVLQEPEQNRVGVSQSPKVNGSWLTFDQGDSCEWIYFQKSRERRVQGQKEVRNRDSSQLFNQSARVIRLPAPTAHWTKLRRRVHQQPTHMVWVG